MFEGRIEYGCFMDDALLDLSRRSLQTHYNMRIYIVTESKECLLGASLQKQIQTTNIFKATDLYNFVK